MKSASRDGLEGTPRALWRTGAKKRLEHNLLALASYCRPVDKVPIDVPDDVDLLPDDPLSNRIVVWPSRDLLLQVQDDVLVLALLERKPPIIPVWRAFEQVNKHAPTLRLVRRVNDLISRAIERLNETGESELSKAARDAKAGSAQSQCLLRDIAMGRRDLGEMLMADHRVMARSMLARSLVRWAINIGHPMAKAFDDFLVEISNEARLALELSRKREKGRERVRRYRLRQNSCRKSVTRSKEHTRRKLSGE
jgi:hypothetical protein